MPPIYSLIYREMDHKNKSCDDEFPTQKNESNQGVKAIEILKLYFRNYFFEENIDETLTIRG